jgi:hypothetical protein
VSLLRRYAPRASCRARLLLAAVLWTGVGTGLALAGLFWIFDARSAPWLAATPVALLAGWVKGRFVLGPRAGANARRIVEAGDGRCLGGAFSWGSWGIALAMMIGGIFLRRSSIPRPWLGLLYTAVGTGLIAASTASWTRWRAYR